MNIELNKFDMKRIRFDPKKSQGPVIVLIGKRGTGKSFLVRDLLYHHQNLKVGAVMSGTEMGNGFYESLLPKCMIHKEYDSNIIEKLLERQKHVMKAIKKQKQVYGRQLPDYDGRIFCILDDCLYDDRWTRDKLMRMLFMNGRHWKIMLIITMQYPLGVPPSLRTNIDYVFILRESIRKNRKKIWENYAGMFETFDFFEKVMLQCTENYECLVIANDTNSNKLSDQVFWYKASQHGDFRLGEQQYWARNHLYESDDDGGEEYDPENFTKKSRIMVRKSNW
jgi:hypothetical protein